MNITITPEDSAYVEKLYYEYISTLDILQFLLEQPTIKRQDIIEQIIERTENRKIELELAKNFILNKYIKDRQNYKNYNFNFNQNIIELEQKEDN